MWIVRTAPLVLLALLLGGCTQVDPETPGTPVIIGEVPVSMDALSEHLDPASSAFQDVLVIEDNLTLPGGGWMEFRTGRGMGCYGNADPVAPNATGWVSCMARVKAKPSWLAQDVHDLGIGVDAQRLTLRMAAEPVEWRLVVTVGEAASHGNGNVHLVWAYDSGWRTVDLSPVIDPPEITVVVRDPCDPINRPSLTQSPDGGSATLYVNFTASHGKPIVEIDLGNSLAGDAESLPYADHSTFEHGLIAVFDTFGARFAGSLNLKVNLEAPETPAEATPHACGLVLGRDVQRWSIDVGIQGADGRQEFRFREVDVEVLLRA